MVDTSFSLPLFFFPLTAYLWKFSFFYSASIYAIGCITGALHGGYLSDKLGRKKCMILDCLGYITGKCFMEPSSNLMHIVS